MNSNDIREEQQDVNSMDVLVSYPRSGSHWLNCVTEWYLQEPRAFMTANRRVLKDQLTFLPDDAKEKQYRWFHSHDLSRQLHHDPKRTMYLYRDPTQVMFSAYKVAQKQSQFTSDPGMIMPPEKFIEVYGPRLRDHLTKYLVGTYRARTVLRYELFIKDKLAEFRKVCDHLGVAFDKDKAASAWRYVTKAKLAEQTASTMSRGMRSYFNDDMDSSQYAKDRDTFSNAHRKRVESTVITRTLAEFFAPVG